MDNKKIREIEELVSNFIEDGVEQCEGSQASQANVVGKLTLYELRRFIQIIKGELAY